MKPQYVKVSTPNQSVVNIRKDKLTYFPKIWHFHNELEIVLILKSTGTRYIGDSIEGFSEGDLVIVGPNLPHSWQNDKKFLKNEENLLVEAIIIHFKGDFLGNDFMKLQEMKHLCNLLHRSKRGIKIIGNARIEIAKRIKELLKLGGFHKTMEFLNILNLMAEAEECKLLASIGFIDSYKQINSYKIDKIHEYIINNISNDISLRDVAAIANMNTTAFCRYFKTKTKKNYTQFLNETRIGLACRLLIENELNITQVAYECGYQSLSNFNKQFKKIIDKTPKEYRKQLLS